MQANRHPDYSREAAYLGRVCCEVDRVLADLENLGWSGAATNASTHAVRDVLGDRRRRIEEFAAAPYFGRVDRIADGEDLPQSCYIGRAGLPSSDGERLVIDWRAPIARYFYSPDEFVRLRRRHRIERRTLLDIHDLQPEVQAAARTAAETGPPLLADPALARLLTGSRGQHLRTIVETIQAEQDALIRSDDQNRIIQGGAGTGKTVVALHRLAYLLYHLRASGGSPKVAVFAPNRLFLRYIGSVLPGLGEREVVQTTFEAWFAEWSGPEVPPMDSWREELERLLDQRLPRYRREEQYRRARLKGSMKMGVVLRRYVERLRADVIKQLCALPLEVPTDVSTGRSPRVTLWPKELAPVARPAGGQPLNHSWASVRRALWDSVVTRIRRMPTRPGLTVTEGEAAVRAARARRVFANEVDRRWARRTVVEVYHSIISDRDVLETVAGDLLTPREVALLETGRELGLEDLAPLSYLQLLLNGPATSRDGQGRDTGVPLRYDHVVVDEAQDFAPLQLAVLREHAGGLTLLGDVAQGIYSYRGIRAWNELDDMFGGAGVRRATLNRSYRSTAQVVDLANRLQVPGRTAEQELIPARPVQGPSPRLQGVPDEPAMTAAASESIRSSFAEGFKTAAIICKTAEDAKQFGALLRRRLSGGWSVVTSRDAGLPVAGIAILPAYLAKGVEFDVVVVVGVDARRYTSGEYDAKLLYTAVTRALHRLTVLCIGKPSPLLPLDEAAQRSDARL